MNTKTEHGHDSTTTTTNDLLANFGAVYDLVDADGEIFYQVKDEFKGPNYPQTIFVSSKDNTTGSSKVQYHCLMCGATSIRKAGLERHYSTRHFPIPEFDCPKLRCQRKGVDGFTRKDHLIEHLRRYHMAAAAGLAKRPRNKGGGA
ncbi:hypothetical protein GP486_006720 [Trichoglossum hirsutum]|uniref:C2H2-type domain-containing protein n=1 Tax=Trichoglossum hirsutum TaxID=265104 RepID=A0A9P8IE04_9PEZI|nr:hypothetical protein GP486_006720 [Trichoglossum hirsutum]